ncbi:hypothetical protein TDB9533_04672 [Thalassocella blandensis]|nr:hypothetical protein TDB9533_04672 [Thalassocella blandensis]
MSQPYISKKRILLCGTRYGQSYLPAIFQSNNLELVGVLAKGSDRSIRIAEQCGIPFYSNVKDIDQAIDIACVALREDIAIPIAQVLISHGCDILIEHPVSRNGIETLQKQARQAGKNIHINTHFPNLPFVTQFIERCREQTSHQPPLLIQLHCNSRTLFSALDILMRCFGEITVSEFQITDLEHYKMCCFKLNNITAILIYQHWRFEIDDSADAPLGHQFTIVYPGGTLSLPSTFSPLVWSATVSPITPLNQLVSTSEDIQIDVSTIVHWRKIANQKALQELCTDGEEKDRPSQLQSDYTMHLCTLWSELFEQLGFQECSQT